MKENLAKFAFGQGHEQWSFSQPFGPSSLYGPPPYAYRAARTISTLARFEGAGLRPYLPPGVELEEPNCLGVVAASKYQEAAFGPYQELSFFVRVIAFGSPYLFSPLMYADGEVATAAGRELWGFAKKVAQMNLVEHDDSWQFTAERRGQEICSVEFHTDRRGTPDEISLVDLPTLTLRLIPSLTGRGAPDIAQLVSTTNTKRPLQSKREIHRWIGRSAVKVGDNPSDPLAPFEPAETLVAWMTEYDCDLPAGVLVHDYREAE